MSCCLICKLLKLSADAIYPLMRGTHLHKHTHTRTHRNAGADENYTNMLSIIKHIKIKLRQASLLLLKGLVHPKMKILSVITHPHVVPTP